MEEDLTCPVCLELYADPLMMPCSHSVCKACLHDVMKSRGKQGKDDFFLQMKTNDFHYRMLDLIKAKCFDIISSNTIRLSFSHNFSDLECPACRQSHKLTAEQVNKLPKNLALENIVFRYQEIRSCSMSNTGNMKTKRHADWFCQQCQVLYCQQCLDVYHPKRGPLVKHKV
ncbi:unnamed protein product, partial [Lymnaea stagnalis]